MTTSEASALLEAVARERGLTVQRLDPEIVVCSDGSRRIVFHGMCGARSSKVAHELCSNVAWLRTHLAAHGIPVVDWRQVDPDDLDAAQRSAAELGFPVALRVGDGTAHTCASARDAAEYRQQWRRLVAYADGAVAWALIERLPTGAPVDVVIVGRLVVAQSRGQQTRHEVAEEVAMRSLGTIPKMDYASVRLTHGAQQLVASLDPTLSSLAATDEQGRQIAAAILDREYDDGRFK